MESADSVLRRSFGEFVVSKQKMKQADGAVLVRMKREQGRQTLGFTSRPFVLCGLPIRRPPKDQLLYERRNGRFVLQITGHPELGLPFGQDRLVPIFLATLAVRQQSQTIRFRSAAQMLETFGMAKGGKEYRRLIAAFERIFGATIFFGIDTHTERTKVVHHARFSFLQETQIWYNRDRQPSDEIAKVDNIVVLSDEFYEEIMQHPVPTDLEAVKVLASAPAVLDLFVWLSYRCYLAHSQEPIPLFGPQGLAGQLGCVEYSRPRRFRAMLEQWLAVIRGLWPDCPTQIVDNRLIIRQGIAITPKPREPI